MDCPTCNEPLVADARFCPSCGRSVATDPDGTTTVQPVDAAVPAAAPVGATPAGAAATDDALQRCPSCGADNSAARVLCARCGADLATGDRPGATPVAHHPGPAEDVTGEVSTPRRTGRTVLIVAAIIAIGGALGLVLGLLLADRDDAPERAQAVFDPGVYTGEPQELAVTGVGASSERPPAGEVAYDAGNLVDGDVTTAWSHDPAVEAAADVDLALALEEPSWVTSLTFANGAQSDDLAFTADGRVLRLRLLVGGDAAAELELLDQPGLQRVVLPEPVLVRTIRLVVLEAVPGDTYDEVSVSEIVVTGHPAQGEDLARMLDTVDGDGDGTDEAGD